jgi:hypothetical protein
MMNKRHTIGLALALTASLMGAIAYLMSNEQTDQKALASSGMSLNGLQLNGLHLNGLGFNGLKVNGLGLNGLVDASNDSSLLEKMARTDQGREVLGVLAACALSAGDALKVSTDDGDYLFSGSLGLAPEWRTGALSEQDQRWVSACLLAHVNGVGAHVPISLRGDHPALQPTIKEVANYQAEEGAFYGNLFGEEPYAASCVGDHGISSPDLKDRVCATEVVGSKTACGFVSAGQCQEVCDVQVHEHGPTYSNCRLSAAENTGVSEVITVFLASNPVKVR